MIAFTLQTENGDHVTTGAMPPFTNGLPHVVFWGSRAFVLHDVHGTKGPIYRERFAWVHHS